MTDTVRLARRFGVAKFEGHCYDFEQLAHVLRKISECSELQLDWEAPDTMKEGNLFATDMKTQVRVASLFDKYFEEEPCVYVCTSMVHTKGEDLKRHEKLIHNESQFFDWIQEWMDSGEKIPEIVVCLKKTSSCEKTDERIFQRLKDICPKARKLFVKTN